MSDHAEPPSWVAVLDYLMEGFGWALTRGMIAGGVEVEKWEIRGQGAGDLQFHERGRTPDEAVARAVVYLSKCHGVRPWEARETLGRLIDEAAAREAEPPPPKPKAEPPQWTPQTSEAPIFRKVHNPNSIDYGYREADGEIRGGFGSVLEAEIAHQAAEAEAAHAAKAAA